MTDPTTPPTMRVYYTDDGIMLGWHPDADDPDKMRALTFNTDDAVGIAAALHETALDGEDRARSRFAVSTTTDGEHLALLWMQDGVVQSLLIPRDTIAALTGAIWQAVDDRDALLRFDETMRNTYPDDFT
ncbi:hypothetical protein H7J71_21860 [Mycolicibacterium peregrinum]|uniref:hypothetical protein n=1 Tax=Mycolicibacterium peregrinum TaxID=43304 RepID=UPI0006D7A408|nr:hypothetical protein [Mycolicibacterium peregrinum]MCV7204661.1 hypothetical protein [Mycolicibacterium peregrinum]ORW60071.1 hypothetical protein AWC21_11355 [Mycolicibacterium peregrinum]